MKAIHNVSSLHYKSSGSVNAVVKIQFWKLFTTVTAQPNDQTKCECGSKNTILKAIHNPKA